MGHCPTLSSYHNFRRTATITSGLFRYRNDDYGKLRRYLSTLDISYDTNEDTWNPRNFSLGIRFYS
jgi:hypothetical protein